MRTYIIVYFSSMIYTYSYHKYHASFRYVGLVTGCCLAEIGNHVVCADLDKKKIDGLNNGVLPIYEPGLDDMAKRNAEQKRLTFSADPITSIKGVDVVVRRYILFSLFLCSHMTYNKTDCFSHSLLQWERPVVVMEERILVMWMMLQKWLQKMLLPKLYW